MAVTLAVAAGVLAGNVPPPARGADAPATQFSAGRALDVVRELAGDGAPRPAGTPANLRAVDAIASRLVAAGLDASVQIAFACGIYGSCAEVRNIVARLGTAAPGRRAVLLVAHHDSVGAGPGVADDLAGVATALEVARAIAAGPPLPRPFIVLLTDGEETGLVGASAFVERHPAAADVGAVVNLEARGTTGPSIAFDTSGAPAWVGRVLSAVRRPVTTSLASAVYHLLPNDTDLTTFERAGFPGVNLAFAFGAVRYHTPLDDVAHLDAASLQHHGDNALALVRAIAAEDLERGARGARAWFDVLGVAVISWPRPREVALAAALAAVFSAFVVLRREPRPFRAGAFGLGAAILAPILAAAAMAVLLAALRAAGALPRPFVAHPLPTQAAAWAAGAAGALLAPALLAPRAGRRGLLAGGALLHGALSATLALFLPLASPIAAVPAAAFALATAVRRLVPPDGPGSLALDALPAACAPLVLSPLAFFLPPLMGAPAGAAAAGAAGLALSPAAFAAGPGARRPFLPGAAALAGAVLLAAAQIALPHATRDAPERLSFVFHEEHGEARWLAEAEHDHLPAAVRAAAAFSSRRQVPFAWQPKRASFVAPAAAVRLAPPRVDLLSSESRAGVRRVRARLVSPRGAPVIMLVLPPTARVVALSVEGILLSDPPPLAGALRGGHRLVASITTPPEGVGIEIVLPADERLDAVVVDQSAGLPPSGAALRSARPATAVPSGDGDRTVATARVSL